jgi:hypothetical protein
MTCLFHYESNPEDDEERNGNDLVKVQLRLQAEGQRFDKISYLISERSMIRDEKRPDKAQKDTSL